jgi:hypothetical protein
LKNNLVRIRDQIEAACQPKKYIFTGLATRGVFRYIMIEPDNLGHFQFGLVYGYIDGRIVDYAEGKRFEFTWEGNDECDHALGSGWVRIKEKDVLEGEFRIHLGDSSTFLARRAK